MEMRADTVFKVSPDVLFQEVNGEMVLLDMAGDTYFGLDAIGAHVWRLLADGNCMSDLLNVLQAEYEVDRATLEADLAELLGSLRNAGLIHS